MLGWVIFGSPFDEDGWHVLDAVDRVAVRLRLVRQRHHRALAVGELQVEVDPRLGGRFDGDTSRTPMRTGVTCPSIGVAVDPERRERVVRLDLLLLVERLQRDRIVGVPQPDVVERWRPMPPPSAAETLVVAPKLLAFTLFRSYAARVAVMFRCM